MTRNDPTWPPKIGGPHYSGSKPEINFQFKGKPLTLVNRLYIAYKRSMDLPCMVIKTKVAIPVRCCYFFAHNFLNRAPRNVSADFGGLLYRTSSSRFSHCEIKHGIVIL